MDEAQGSLRNHGVAGDGPPSSQELLLRAECEAIFANAIEAIVCADALGTITRANPAAERIFGYPPGELIGRNVRCLVPPPDRERHDDYIRHYLESGAARIIGVGREVTGVRRDGSEVPLDISILDITVDGVRGFTAVMRDISERRRSEALLRERNQEISAIREQLAHLDRARIANTLSADIAHELTQPLTAIKLFAKSCRRILDSGADDRDTLEDTLSRIEGVAQQAGDIIHNLRSVHRPQPLVHGQVDVNALIQETVELAVADSPAARDAVEMQLEPDLPLVDMARTQIQLVLLNLIRNAREALADSPRASEGMIRIASSRLSGDRIQVTVQDSGPGVPAGEIERVFQPFHSAKAEHLGMGLPISRGVIESHGGELHVNAERSEGAEFYFTLPVTLTGDVADVS